MLSDGNFFKNAEDERDEKLSIKINQENIMYKSMLAFLLAISTFLWSEEPPSIHKEYVRPDQVIITESGIIAFLGTYPSKKLRRFWGSFEPIFDSFCRGSIRS